MAVAHISWACEAFAVQHGKDLQTPELAGYWRSIMVKLREEGHIDVKTFTNCNRLLEDISLN